MYVYLLHFRILTCSSGKQANNYIYNIDHMLCRNPRYININYLLPCPVCGVEFQEGVVGVVRRAR